MLCLIEFLYDLFFVFKYTQVHILYIYIYMYRGVDIIVLISWRRDKAHLIFSHSGSRNIIHYMLYELSTGSVYM